MADISEFLNAGESTVQEVAELMEAAMDNGTIRRWAISLDRQLVNELGDEIVTLGYAIDAAKRLASGDERFTGVHRWLLAQLSIEQPDFGDEEGEDEDEE